MSVWRYDCYTDTVVGLELLVCLSTGLRCSLINEAVFKSKPVSGFSYVLFVTVVTLFHVDKRFLELQSM